MATTPANYAEIQIVYANDVVEGLKAGQVTTGGNQKALGNFLKNATKNIQKGNYAQAIVDLNQARVHRHGIPIQRSRLVNSGTSTTCHSLWSTRFAMRSTGCFSLARRGPIPWPMFSRPASLPLQSFSSRSTTP